MDFRRSLGNVGGTDIVSTANDHSTRLLWDRGVTDRLLWDGEGSVTDSRDVTSDRRVVPKASQVVPVCSTRDLIS